MGPAPTKLCGRHAFAPRSIEPGTQRARAARDFMTRDGSHISNNSTQINARRPFLTVVAFPSEIGRSRRRRTRQETNGPRRGAHAPALPALGSLRRLVMPIDRPQGRLLRCCGGCGAGPWRCQSGGRPNQWPPLARSSMMLTMTDAKPEPCSHTRAGPPAAAAPNNQDGGLVGGRRLRAGGAAGRGAALQGCLGRRGRGAFWPVC